MKKKKALGRGLSSFISEDEFINSSENNIKTDQLYLPIEYIKPNPDQPRKIFDERSMPSIFLLNEINNSIINKDEDKFLFYSSDESSLSF